MYDLLKKSAFISMRVLILNAALLDLLDASLN